jgi:hypothetical protein
MPLTTEQIELQKRIYRQISVDVPIEPNDDRYVPSYELFENDPISELKNTINFLEVESTQFFSGFRGSGKSTQLRRLRKELEKEGCVVLYADALTYINPAVPLNITELLISIAGAFSDTLQEKFGNKIIKENYWTRLWNYLNTTEVELKEFGLGIGGTVGIADVSGNIKLALKETPSFRQRVQEVMKNRINKLKDDVEDFIKDGVKLIQEVHGEDVKIVFIFDSLEKLRGSFGNEDEIIKSVEDIFTQNIHLLKLRNLNTIYTVPPWLNFKNIGESIVPLRGIKQWENDSERTKYAKGNDIFREIIKKRFKEDGMKLFFGSDKNADGNLDKLIDNCGGSLRVLLRMLNLALLRVKDTPFSSSLIDGVVAEIENSFVISIEDAFWLDKIAENRSESLENSGSDSISKFTRLIDTHLVLYFRNGNDWYDIHPLVRDKVARIIAQNPTNDANNNNE